MDNLKDIFIPKRTLDFPLSYHWKQISGSFVIISDIYSCIDNFEKGNLEGEREFFWAPYFFKLRRGILIDAKKVTLMHKGAI